MILLPTSPVRRIADTLNDAVRYVYPNGTIVTVAGNGTRAYSGDGGSAISSLWFQPDGIVNDGAGGVYVSTSLSVDGAGGM